MDYLNDYGYGSGSGSGYGSGYGYGDGYGDGYGYGSGSGSGDGDGYGYGSGYGYGDGYGDGYGYGSGSGSGDGDGYGYGSGYGYGDGYGDGYGYGSGSGSGDGYGYGDGYGDGYGSGKGVDLNMISIFKFKPTDILQEENAEIRARMISANGIVETIQALGAKTIEHGIDHNGEPCELLNFDVIDGTFRPYIKLINPSTGTCHIEGVHPDCNTIAKALAWRNRSNQKPEILT